MGKTKTFERTACLALSAIAALLCAFAIFFMSPSQAWADAVSTPDEFVVKTADPAVSSIELTSDMDMTDKGFVDVSGKTIDLGGFTLSNNNFTFGLQGSDFRVTNGTIKCNDGSYALFIGDDPTSNVVIDGVTFKGGINIYNSTNVVLRNVDVEGLAYYAVWCDRGAQVTIKSGTYSSAGNAVLALATGDNGQSMNVAGGVFAVVEGQSLVNEQGGNAALPVVSGGTFNTSDVAKYTAGNSAALADNGSFEVMSKDDAIAQAAAVVDGVYYKSAQEAENAAASGGGTVVPSYKVTFTGNGITDSFVFANENDTIAAPAAPVREGYDFKGWFDGETEWAFGADGTKVTEPVTLTAKWDAQSRIVTFDDCIKSTSNKVETVSYGDKVSKPADPVLDGWKFEGWFSDTALTQEYDFNAAVTSNIVLYAKWSKVDPSIPSVTDPVVPGSEDLASMDKTGLAKTGDSSTWMLLAGLGVVALIASGSLIFAYRKLR
ncbi:MAG: InlB B-repeat-containing protein [Eggerthellaceae bacterium]